MNMIVFNKIVSDKITGFYKDQYHYCKPVEIAIDTFVLHNEIINDAPELLQKHDLTKEAFFTVGDNSLTDQKYKQHLQEVENKLLL